MPIDIKLNVSLSLEESSLEDALEEYDELTVHGLIKEIIDKAIACDEVTATVDEGPDTLEALDSLKGG